MLVKATSESHQMVDLLVPAADVKTVEALLAGPIRFV